MPTRAGSSAPVITTGEVGASKTGAGAVAVMPTVAVPVLPPSSVTVNVAVYDPGAYVCDGFAEVEVPPSPNAQA